MRSCAGHIALWTYHAYQTSVISVISPHLCHFPSKQEQSKKAMPSQNDNQVKVGWQTRESGAVFSEQTQQSLRVQSTLSGDALLEAEKHIPNISKDSKTHYCISIDVSSETCGSYFFHVGEEEMFFFRLNSSTIKN